MDNSQDDSSEFLFERIRAARERSEMTVDEASDALGVSRVQIWRLENKSKTVSAERLFELADLYGVDARQLLLGSDTGKSTNTLYRRIGEVVSMVEEQAQLLDVKPSPSLIGEVVVEVLRQEANKPINAKSEPFDPNRYKGLVALLFK